MALSEDLDKKYRTYKNVYREALMWGLPMKMCLWFGAATLVNLLLIYMIGVLAGLWYVGIVQVLANVLLFFLLKGMVEKFGVYFIDKLTAHYMQHTFTIIRRSRQTSSILKKK